MLDFSSRTRWYLLIAFIFSLTQLNFWKMLRTLKLIFQIKWRMFDDSLILLRVINRYECRKKTAMSFFVLVQRKWISQFVFIPGKVRIEFDANAFPELDWGLLQHHRHVWKLGKWSACFELASILPTKSTYSQFKMKLEIEVNGVTVAGQWSGSCTWGIWKVLEWS